MDYFALLDQPRLPWLDPDALKTKFHALSNAAHPDRIHEASAAEKETATKHYAELNAAYHCLREPKDRLAHLLELSLGRRPADIQNPAGAADLFFAIAPAAQGADQFLRQRGQAASPLARAQLYAVGLEWSDKLMQLQSRLTQRREILEAELKHMSAAWPTAPALDRLSQLYGEFSFLKRSSEQIHERLSRLAVD
ncbi:MAG TPA: hypothetical protein VHB20_07800 [Verrucomicrobiae bacterium]|jgi:curved DNA-binding protein CbpA|nr:hypothetical protein [Verrucomicrobiae bacterium]